MFVKVLLNAFMITYERLSSIVVYFAGVREPAAGQRGPDQDLQNVSLAVPGQPRDRHQPPHRHRQDTDHRLQRRDSGTQ